MKLNTIFIVLLLILVLSACNTGNKDSILEEADLSRANFEYINHLAIKNRDLNICNNIKENIELKDQEKTKSVNFSIIEFKYNECVKKTSKSIEFNWGYDYPEISMGDSTYLITNFYNSAHDTNHITELYVSFYLNGTINYEASTIQIQNPKSHDGLFHSCKRDIWKGHASSGRIIECCANSNCSSKARILGSDYLSYVDPIRWSTLDLILREVTYLRGAVLDDSLKNASVPLEAWRLEACLP